MLIDVTSAATAASVENLRIPISPPRYAVGQTRDRGNGLTRLGGWYLNQGFRATELRGAFSGTRD
jgi:hypothetical protein